MRDGNQDDPSPPRRIVRLPTSAENIDAEIDAELRFHLDARIEELVGKGMSVERAREEATREFGDLAASRRELARVDRERIARGRLIAAWDGLVQDARAAWRSLRRQPGFAALIVVTLAVAIGANAAMFSIIDRLLLRGPDYVRDPDRVGRVYMHTDEPGRGSRTRSVISYPDLAALREGAGSFAQVAGYALGELTTGDGPEARTVRVVYATPDFFPLIGVRPFSGRFFNADEDRPPAGSRVVVLDHGLWATSFGADSGIVGRTIRFSGIPHTVIGIAPPGFTGVELARVDAWLPLASLGNRVRENWQTTRDSRWLSVVARLRDGTGIARADVEATTILRRATPASRIQATLRATILPIARDREGRELPEAPVSRWLVGVAIVVLVIACANVANLLLARATRRRREVAVRLALGIGRFRLLRLLLLESLMLAGAGALGGLFIAYRGTPVVRAALLPNVVWTSAPVNGRVVALAVVIAMVTGVLVGLAPALQAGRTDLTGSLKTGARDGGGHRSRLRQTLLVLQPALAVLLLVGAGLFVQSLRHVRSLELGLETDRVLTVNVRWPFMDAPSVEQASAERTRRRQFQLDALDRLASTPMVEHVSIAIGTPFETGFGVDVKVPGRDSLPELPGGGPYITVVTSDYFATVGTRLVRGRLFTPQDRAGSERVVVVNETMASTLWPDAEALDKCLILFADSVPCARVVGIVRDVHRFRLVEGASMQFYVPSGQELQISGGSLLVRPRDPVLARAVEPLRRELQTLRPDLPYVSIRPLQDTVDPQMRPWRLGAFLFTLFGAMALVLASVGLYSVLAYLVEQRRYELGVRAALGASSGAILRDTLMRGVVPAIAGLAIGVALALALGRFVEPMLFETTARDPLVFGAVSVLLAAVSVAATLVPAVRATRADPLVALRAE